MNKLNMSGICINYRKCVSDNSSWEQWWHHYVIGKLSLMVDIPLCLSLLLLVAALFFSVHSGKRVVMEALTASKKHF